MANTTTADELCTFVRDRLPDGTTFELKARKGRSKAVFKYDGVDCDNGVNGAKTLKQCGLTPRALVQVIPKGVNNDIRLSGAKLPPPRSSTSMMPTSSPVVATPNVTRPRPTPNHGDRVPRRFPPSNVMPPTRNPRDFRSPLVSRAAQASAAQRDHTRSRRSDDSRGGRFHTVNSITQSGGSRVRNIPKGKKIFSATDLGFGGRGG